MKTTKLHLLVALTTAIILSGCTVVGEDEFSCPTPETGACLNAATAYKLAENPETIRNIRTNKKVLNKSNSEGNSEKKNTTRNVAPVVATMSKPLFQPKPVLMPAEVLRVWVNSYEDDRGILHMPQTAYVEITPRKWALGANDERQFKTSAPFTIAK
jgi:conjugal transfer pilus assembly protein TraV